MAYEHLRLEKESPVTDRHRQRGFGAPAPPDPRGHGNALLRSFRAAREVAANQDLGGFDDRKLLKIRLREGERQLPDFNLIDGLEVVSQEGHEVVLAKGAKHHRNTSFLPFEQIIKSQFWLQASLNHHKKTRKRGNARAILQISKRSK